MKRLWLTCGAVGVLALSACEDTIGPEGNASPADRQEILAALDSSGYSDESVDGDGFSESYAVAPYAASPFGAAASPDAEVVLPRYWGRRLTGTVSRTRTVNVTGDSATVEMEGTFDGSLRALIPNGDLPPDTLHRVFQHTVRQTALLVKRDANADGRRGWRLAQISPQEWVMTDPAKQTMDITRVVISVNGEVKIDVTDPAALYDVSNHVPRLDLGDEISVRVELANTANTGNTPPEFVFVHSLYADPLGIGWRRMRMEQADDGSYQKTWVARHGGRNRILVDALDSQTFAETGEYRANLWGIPYRIGN